ncbi:MAG: winged helix-turn-helix domain-containing protein [Sphingosinicella sp.]|nr:winged helix-turn-helix domain-containing protein [Sphingosinicella sp.]
MTQILSLPQARRIALAAQGLARPKRATPVTPRRMREVSERLGLHQIDSVNVLVRAHYMPLFSRLGIYSREMLDQASWGRKRRLFEYWAHEASLLPLEYQPLLRWRMARAERGEGVWKNIRSFATERRESVNEVLARIEAEGPLGSSDFEEGKSRTGWWEWGDTKRALEWLFWIGRITTATRRGSFERVYDLTERVLPGAIMEMPTPDEPDAHRALLAKAGQALGIATAGDLRDYFRLKPGDSKPRIDELVEAGILRPVQVRGWTQPAYLHADAHSPRRATGQALLAPFDPLIWDRSRTERLFGIRYRIEIYTPAERRVHGYYVLPFLLDDRIVARVDLKADRQAGALRVQAAYAEPGAPTEAAERLMFELRSMAGWLGLERLKIAPKGDFASRLQSLSG